MTGLVGIAYFAFLVGIFATLLLGWRTDNFPAVVNAVAAFAVALFPTLAEAALGAFTELEVAFGPELPLWLAAAGFLHMLGMLGWYDSVWWWDHLTHTVSAALLAALVYAGLHTLDSADPEINLSFAYVAAFTVLFTLVAGIFWELLELVAREVGEQIDHPPVLEHYGLRDTALDLGFNCIGALLVVALDVRVFVSLTDQGPATVELLLVSFAIGFSGGAILLGVLLDASDSSR